MIQYIVLKYPNTEEFLLGTFVVEYRDWPEHYHPEGELDWAVDNLHCSLAALKRLKDYKMQIKIPPQMYLDDTTSRIQTEDNFMMIGSYYRMERLLLARPKPRHPIEFKERICVNINKSIVSNIRLD